MESCAGPLVFEFRRNHVPLRRTPTVSVRLPSQSPTTTLSDAMP